MSFRDLCLSIRGEFPYFRLVEKKDSSFMKFLDFCLKLITFWQMKKFMTSFTTTIGFTVYTPEGWVDWSEKVKVAILRHERIHMRQKERDKCFFVKYLLLPFPILWAYYRMKYEMEAYEETMKVMWEYRGIEGFTDEFKQSMVRHFTSAEYFWTWPWKKRIEAWYDGVVQRMQG
jgi:hypothetical protein